MNTMKKASARANERRFARIGFSGGLAVQWGPEAAAPAVCVNIGRGGMCVKTHVALEPGQRVLVHVTSWRAGGDLEFKGQTVWTRGVGDGFLMGLRIYLDEARVADDVSALMYEALADAGVIAAGTEEPETVEWPLMALASAARVNEALSA